MTARPDAPELTAAPVPPEVRVEAVARAIGEEWCTPLPWDELSLATQNECRRLAAAAIAALSPSPSPAEEAVKRVEALCEFADGTGRVVFGISGSGAVWVRDIRAALASPAPAPQGEEGQR